ncbi:patatin-like phospholipase family protein [Streptomyces beijiangensis]|uniref:Patatin-like phospholipase family protein n=1 Tax=Streptomyces beijiangensis TaxID=163361 RepID=A0A939JGX1_9ACTN|nr:patatin-like phospholipase family protein [Streptomyces beijiangensis]MBO0511550.1 patatin-like phospholipase family protein [Streptomyces beijiangensis]
MAGKRAAVYWPAGIRLVNGTTGLLALKVFIGRIDPESPPNPAAVYAFRMFGMRTVLLGLGLLTSHGDRLEQELRAAVLIHASDTLTAGVLAEAVRCSLSIPFYFRPCTLTDPVTKESSVIVDGGVLSNFAVEIFDRKDGKESRWPTFGVQILPDLPAGNAELFPALVGRDQTHLEQPGVRDRTMTVDCSGVGITDFSLGEEQRETVVAEGLRESGRFARTSRPVTARPSSPVPDPDGGRRAQPDDYAPVAHAWPLPRAGATRLCVGGVAFVWHRVEAHRQAVR